MSSRLDDTVLLAAATEQARKSAAESGIPIGAVLVTDDGEIVGRGHNLRVQTGDPTAHGEISCLRDAGRRRDYRNCVMYTTLAPCSMCTGAILLFQIPRVVVGESANYPGELDLLRSRGVDVQVVDDAECVGLMRRFIEEHPEVWNEDIGI